MKILVISDTSQYMLGGVPAEARHLVHGLTAAGHQVGTLTDRPVGNDDAYHLSFPVAHINAWPAVIERALHEFSPDVIHVLSVNIRGLFLMRRILAGRPWLLTCHSLPPHERKVDRWHGSDGLYYGFRAIRFAPNVLAWGLGFMRVKPVTVVHSAFMTRVVAGFGLARRRIFEIPLVVADLGPELCATPRPRPTEIQRQRPLRIVSVGGFAHSKGQADLVRALPAVSSALGPIECRLVGEIREPGYVRHLQGLMEKLSPQVDCQLVISAPDSLRRSLLDEADIYVQPSHEEGFCLAFSEALVSVPRLVGTDAGAISVMANQAPGTRIVSVQSPNEISRALINVWGDEVAEQDMVKRRAFLQKKFGREAYINAHEAVYRDVLAA